MKRNFILGFGLIAFIFIVSGLFIYSNLSSIAKNHTITRDHQDIINLYLDIENEVKDIQIELHERWVGHTKDNAILGVYVLKSEDLLSRIRNTYGIHKHEAICNNCHHVAQKLNAPDKDLARHLSKLKEKINLIMANNATSTFALEKETEIEVSGIVDIINSLSLETRSMHGMMNKYMEASNASSRHLVVIAIISSFILSLIIMTFTIRSIMNPINRLIAEIEKTSDGDYTSKVDVVMNDEISSIARSFNAMKDNLKESDSQKKELIEKLQDFNNKLEKRVHAATEKLRIAHENLVRTEGLAIAGTLASGVAHELSSPLSTLMGYSQLINNKVPEEFGVAPYCNLMEKEIKRCEHILKGILDSVRTPNEEKSLIDINAMIIESVLFISLRAGCKNVFVKDDLDPQIPHVMANPIGLRQVLLNIIINAIQAMPDGGELRISTSFAEKDKKVVVSISDTGHGIAKNDIGKIFKTFYTTKKTGTGLGLSISYGIIKEHGGDITIKSEIGKGSTFEISLPVSVDSAASVTRGDAGLTNNTLEQRL
ncbi:MAG: HAMP domain-containing protein [Nitrospirae bacterium]|nr:HAMP domain-containing protein [Nitrospirota bacterium]